MEIASTASGKEMMTDSQAELRLCFVGPMVGRNPGYVTTQGEILADHFASAGYPTISVSASPNRYARLCEIITTLLRKRRGINIQCLQVFGGPSFIVEDVASWLGRSFGQRLVMVLRGGAMPEFMARYPAWSCRVLRRADIIVTPSPFLARAVARFGFTARAVPNMLDLTRYPYRYRKQLGGRLFWMRSFHPAYNPEMAVRVLAHVREAVPEATLVIAGQNKGTQDDVKYLACSLGLDRAVRFPGYLDMTAKLQEANAADIFLNTNHIDNVPVSVIEACAMGLPVVATNVGGIPDLLKDGETALLVPDDDDNAMAEAVRRLLRDPELAGRLSANGRKLAESFSWEHVRPQWEKLFRDVLARPRRRRGDSN
jgi:glycosyltransferase involved in cell wall biosynthesis